MSRPLLIGSFAPSGAERVATRLGELGVDLVISLPGTQVLPIWDALDRVGRSKLIVPRSERSGALIAEGFGLASGRPAAVMNTLGPGVGNEAVAMASAKLSCAPVLFVTPWQPPSKRARINEVFQGLDHPAYLAGPAKEQLLCDDGSDIEAMLDRAHSAAIGDPAGPVRLDISYPLLFKRSRKRAVRLPSGQQMRPPGAAAGADLILALDSAQTGQSPTLASAGLSADLDRAAIPGIDSPGMGAPFALGLRLGRPRTPVVLVLTAESLLAQLDTIVVANAAGVAVTIAAGDGSPAAIVAREVVETTGAAWWPVDFSIGPEALRASMLERTRGLSLLVV